MALKIAIKTVLDESRQSLECIVEELQEQFGHSEEAAIDLLERFNRRFPGREFKELYPFETRSLNDVFSGYLEEIAYRIQYFEFLGRPLDEQAFFDFYFALSQDYDYYAKARNARRVANLQQEDQRVPGWELRRLTNWCLEARYYDMAVKTKYALELPLSVDLSHVNGQWKVDDGVVRVW